MGRGVGARSGRRSSSIQMVPPVGLIPILKLGGFDQPLFGGKAKPFKNRRSFLRYMAPFVRMDEPPSVIHQIQVIAQAEQDASLGLIPDRALKVQ